MGLANFVGELLRLAGVAKAASLFGGRGVGSFGVRHEHFEVAKRIFLSRAVGRYSRCVGAGRA